MKDSFLDLIFGVSHDALPVRVSGYPLQLLVLVGVLRRAFADFLRHLGELAPGHLVLDGLDVDLVPPVVAEVEPVAEAVADLQAQRVEGRLIDTAYRRGGVGVLGFLWGWRGA